MSSFAISEAEFGSFDVNHPTGEHFWSPEMKRMFGLDSGADADFATVFHLVHPVDRRHVVAAMVRSLDHDGPKRFCFESRICLPDGSERWILVAARTVFESRGAEPLPICTVGIVFDITEHKCGKDRALPMNTNRRQMTRSAMQLNKS